MVDSTGAFSSSGSLTDTSYTIEGLESTTIYTITVTVSNTAGSTDSQPIIVSTGMCLILGLMILLFQLLVPTSEECCAASGSTCSETDNTPAIIGGVIVAIVLIVSITIAVTVIVLVLVRNLRGSYSTRTQKRCG